MSGELPAPFVWLSPPHVGERERELIVEALDSNWVAPLGPMVDRFEAMLAQRCQRPSAAALSSGTAALHLALRMAGIKDGDHVAVSDLTFVASATPVLYERAVPVLVDADPVTFGIAPQPLEDALRDHAQAGRPIKAVIAVDLYGNCPDYRELAPLCARYGATLIEDAAESLGSIAYGQPAGSYGEFAALSFNGNKIITTSGGGALLAGHEQAKRARWLAAQAREPKPYYEHHELGFNYRMSNLLAAIGVAQLESLEQRVARRRAIRERYHQALSDLDGVRVQVDPHGQTSNAWLTVVLLDPRRSKTTPEELRVDLLAQQIESRQMWQPMGRQPLFAGAKRVGAGHADTLFQTGVCLPSGSSMDEATQERVILAVRRHLLSRVVGSGASHHGATLGASSGGESPHGDSSDGASTRGGSVGGGPNDGGRAG